MRFPTVAICAMAALEATKLTGPMIWAAVSGKLGSVRVSSSAGSEVRSSKSRVYPSQRSTCSDRQPCCLLDPNSAQASVKLHHYRKAWDDL